MSKKQIGNRRNVKNRKYPEDQQQNISNVLEIKM